MIKRQTLGLAALAALVSTAGAAEKRLSAIGNFVVNVGRDSFEGRDTVIATAFASPHAIALRCLENGLSLAVFNFGEHWKEGAIFEIKVKAAAREPVTVYAAALDENMLEVSGAGPVFDYLAGAQTLAVKVTSVTAAYSFEMPLRGVDKVMALARKACAR